MDKELNTTNGEDCGHFVCIGIIFIKPFKAAITDPPPIILSALNRLKKSREEKNKQVL